MQHAGPLDVLPPQPLCVAGLQCLDFMAVHAVAFWVIARSSSGLIGLMSGLFHAVV